MIAGSIAGVLICIYIGVAVFLMSHFQYNTTINGEDFSWKKVADVNSYIKAEVAQYSLVVKGKEDKKETISGKDLSLTYKNTGIAKQSLKKQNPFLWPVSFFKKSNEHIKVDVTYDEAALEEQVKKLNFVTDEGLTDPVNALPKFNGETFVVEPEVLGTKVDLAVLTEQAGAAVSAFEQELDLEEAGCYLKPAYTSESKEVQAACDTMNNYCKASITYDMSPNTEVVDKTLISGWVSCDANMNVTLNQDAVAAYMNEFGGKYNTLWSTRSITSPWGKTAEVTPGTYGWSIDVAAETQALIACIQAGETVVKEPAYAQRAATHEPQDWGRTYIEVDLSEQYMWYIADGNVVMETPVVTGKPVPATVTPPGAYFISEKLMYTTLVGNIVPETGEPEYRTPVDYWMRITGSGIGFHDANWQSSFGGDVYTWNGSHGCINMPYDAVSVLYNSADWGTPAILHY